MRGIMRALARAPCCTSHDLLASSGWESTLCWPRCAVQRPGWRYGLPDAVVGAERQRHRSHRFLAGPAVPISHAGAMLLVTAAGLSGERTPPQPICLRGSFGLPPHVWFSASAVGAVALGVALCGAEAIRLR